MQYLLHHFASVTKHPRKPNMEQRHLYDVNVFPVCSSGWCWSISGGGDGGAAWAHRSSLGLACLGLAQGEDVGAGTTVHEDCTVALEEAKILPLYSLDCCKGSRKSSSVHLSTLNMPFFPYCLQWQKEPVPRPQSIGEWHPVSDTLLKNLEPAVTMLIYLVLLDENSNYNSTDAVQSKTSSCCNHHSYANFEGNNLLMPAPNLAFFWKIK